MIDSLLNTAPVGFLSIADDGVIVDANRTLAEWLGQERRDIVGEHVGTILTPGGRIFYQTHFFPMLRMERAADEVYLALRSRSGDDVPVLMYGRRLERDGTMVNDCAVVPVRQRRRFEEELVKARRAAEAASQAKAKFLSMMSHELRTPLNAISLQATAFLEGLYGELADEQRSAIERIISAGDYLRTLVTDILNFAKLESGHIEMRLGSVSVAKALDRVDALMLPRLHEAGLAYERGACPDGLVVMADADRLQQILLNLVSNAIKFTPRGGRVWISCEQMADRISICVGDSGAGIDPEEIERIFEPFVQSAHLSREMVRQGAGLGLSISRELARAMGGELSVESRVGSGSIFTVTLSVATVEPTLAVEP
jgi:PAS domain S-box-containing protein